ncbi:transmembrane protein 241 isoform X2 [Patella vulgata]|uniref:transmembrane protein 241 isoform X2 n=1 Tax=Patella vulgata TaxID=6465 RepID=UPI00218009B0|nr:transmembrane protein 241 isoform X2 [Patella vulgata]
MIVSTNGKKALYLSVLFVLLFVATNFVNKFVLSVLKFTYPTIFQGWQTLVGAVMIKILISAGIMEPITPTLNRSDVALWLPGMMLYVISIYSGSKALASLTIPIYFTQQNLVLVFRQIATMSINKQMTSLFNYVMLMLVVVSCVAVIKTDPMFNAEGYFWVSIHVVCSGLIEIYTQLINGRLKLK